MDVPSVPWSTGFVIPILYRDAHLAVVDKPAGLLTHRTELAPDRDVAMMRARDTLDAHVYPLHRLDRGTSGALAFALTEEAARTYRTAFDEGTIEKVYIALARGIMPPAIHVEHPIPKAEGKERVMAVTDFRRLWPPADVDVSEGWFCLVEARPRTGKFHQIRRHLSHLRHPIAGDTNYGTGWFTRKVREEGGLTRLALHATAIEFPVMAEPLSVGAPPDADAPADRALVRSLLPVDFRTALERIGVPASLLATL